MKNSLVKIQKWKKSKSGKLYLGSVWVNPNKDKKEPKEKKTISFWKQRLFLANKAPLITMVEPLALTRSNYIKEVKAEYAKLQDYIKKNGGIVCNCLKAKITKLNTRHELYKNGRPRDFNDVLNHASYIPFIVPVLKTGITSEKLCRTMNNGDSSFEVIGRAEVSSNGKKQRIGVSVVIVKSKENGIYTKVSVFKLTDINGVIKSLLTTTLRRSIYLKRRINLFCNDSIALKRDTDKQYCNNFNDSNAPLSNVEYIYL